LLKSQRIFLTGATGVLGAHLLKQLLIESDSDIYCLVRATDTKLGTERLHSFLKAYDPDGLLDDAFKSRVHAVCGDVVLPKLGLKDQDYEALADSTDVTIHSAAFTNLFSNRRRIEPINVGGTKTIIEFCLKTHQKYLCYISTHTIVGSRTFDPSCIFKEKDFDVGQNFDHMSYQYTKFVAEKLVRDASESGLRWNIMRPGQIFGESQTGHYPQGQTNVSGLFYDIFKTVIETGCAFKSQSHFDIVPVDYVSRSILYLALIRPEIYETYHLTNPDVKCYTDVISLLMEIGYPIEFISQDEYRRRINERAFIVNGEEYKSSTLSAFKWWFKRDGFDFTDSGFTDCTYTKSILEEVGISCSPINRQLLSTYIKAGIEQNYFPDLDLKIQNPGSAVGVSI
jgi:thioester reductase-like protein